MFQVDVVDSYNIWPICKYVGYFSWTYLPILEWLDHLQVEWLDHQLKNNRLDWLRKTE